MRYQDFVIKDGKFIGEFEKMYQLFDDPWNQKKDGYVENSISRQIVCNYIKHFDIKSIVEVGCGLGKTSNFIKKQTDAKVLGIDISSTSIDKAKNSYPDILFEVDDVLNLHKYIEYDAVFFSEITWYLLEDKLIDRALDLLSQYYKGKFFIHNLVFYKGQQKYGVDYFTDLQEFIKFCPFKPIAKVEIDITASDCIETSVIFEIN
jgi:SAM-dependent methyltransferase